MQLLGVNDDLAISLAGASVTFYFREQANPVAKVSGSSVSITDAANGKVEYQWAATDLDVPGVYDAEFRVEFSDGRKQSVIIPDVVVLEKLG